MRYPLILAFKFKDYKGGESSLLVYIFIACVVLGLAASFWVYYKRWSLRELFYSICRERKLSKEQLDVFIHYMNMQKVPLDPQIITNRIRFDKFINRVGYHLVAMHESSRLAENELKILIELRKILFPNKDSKEISSSRYLKKGALLSISFFDDKKSRFVPFKTKILENTDCGMRVLVDQTPGVGQVNLNSPLNVQFQDPVKQHIKMFESYLMFKEGDEEELIWLLQHSYFIQEERCKELSIEGKVYLQKEASVDEVSVSITSLSMNGCDVLEDGFPEGRALLQIVLLDKECNISIKVDKKESGGSMLTFITLDDDVRSQIRKAMR